MKFIKPNLEKQRETYNAANIVMLIKHLCIRRNVKLQKKLYIKDWIPSS